MSIDSLLETLLVPPYPLEKGNEVTQHPPSIKACCPSSLGSPINTITFDDALSVSTNGLAISPLDVRDALSAQNIEDWHNGIIDTDALTGFATLMVQSREIDKGTIPTHFTERAFCKHCGPVWLFTAQDVIACPWCVNGEKDRPIPRPSPIRCSDCAHFTRTNHSHLGHCEKKEPESVAGLWDTDRRSCNRYSPKASTSCSQYSRPK